MQKTILITGSTDGIGKLTAIKLAESGHKILLHGRNHQKLNLTISEIQKISGNQEIQGFIADFADLNSVNLMSNEIKKIISSLDILINNAGVFKSKETRNEAGFDVRFVVNYFAPFLLTRELTPLLEQAKSPRVINLSSAAQATVSIKALNGDLGLSTQEAYAQSKLALTIWSFKLARELKSVSVLAVNPGSLLNTKMVQEAYGQHWSPADKGADILYSLADSEKYSGITEHYYDNDKGTFAPAHPDAYNDEKITELISVTESILANHNNIK